MKIGIVGGGVTGSATAAAFRGHVDEVRVWDWHPIRRTVEYEWHVWDCDVVFVCLPEEEILKERGSYFAVLPDERRKVNFVLRSTVPVGTTRRLAERHGLTNLVHSPEFLTERTAVEDAANPRLNVIGWPVKAGPWTKEDSAFVDNPVHELYATRWPHVSTRIMRSDESELVKLATNTFFATKVSFWNEVESYCRAAGVDWETVRAACVVEGRVGDLHTHVPGPDGQRGFGGRCLPKDLRQLIRCLTDAGVAAPVMTAVLVRNERLDGRGE